MPHGFSLVVWYHSSYAPVCNPVSKKAGLKYHDFYFEQHCSIQQSDIEQGFDKKKKN